MKELIGLISKQSNRYIITGISNFDELFDASYINHWDITKPLNKQGLQRKPVPNHYRKLATALSDSKLRTWIPTPIVLSSGFPLKEKRDSFKNIVGFDTNDQISIELLGSDIMTKNQLVSIKFVPNSFSVIDGQHRLKALEYLIVDKGLSGYKHYNLPFIIMFPTDKIDEIVTFIDLNSKGKKVKTDLANQLRLEIDKEDKHYIQSNTETKKMISTKVSNMLNQEIDSIWYNIISMGNGVEGGLVSSTSWVSSLSQIYSVPSVKAKYESTNKNIDIMSSSLLNILNKYWETLRELSPNLFANDISKKEKYLIQKTAGVSIMNQVLIGILNGFITKPIDKISKSEIKVFLRDNFDCNEYLSEDFWRSSDKKSGVVGGRASESSSESAFKKLSDEILEDISDKFYSED